MATSNLYGLEQAAQFIELLTGESDPVCTFQTFDDNKTRLEANQKLFSEHMKIWKAEGHQEIDWPEWKSRGWGKADPYARIFHDPLSKIGPRLKALNQDGAGVFMMINAGDLKGRKEGNVIGIRANFVDCDKPETLPLTLLAASGLDPDFIVESSQGKYHMYFRVAGCPCDKVLFAGTQVTLAKRLQGDEKVKDMPRVMRLPGFYHAKNPASRFLTRIHEVRHQDRVTNWGDFQLALGLSEAELKAVGGTKAQDPAKKGSTGVNHFDPRTAFGLQLKDGEGRNNHLVQMAGFCAGQGWAIENCLEKCHAWNQQNFEPLQAAVVDDVVTRIWNKEKEKRDEFPLTELGFAQRWAHENRAGFRYVVDGDKWLFWDNGGWSWDEGSVRLQASIQKAARRLQTEAANCGDEQRRQSLSRFNREMEKARGIRAVMSLVRTMQQLVVFAHELDSYPMLLAVMNGVVDLNTGDLKPNDPAWLLTNQAPVFYDPDANSPLWRQFVSEIMRGGYGIDPLPSASAGLLPDRPDH